MRNRSALLDLLRKVWYRLQSVPIWFKIFGIVIAPILLLLLATITFFHGQLTTTLKQYLPPETLEAVLRDYTENVQIAFGLLLLVVLLTVLLLSRILTRPLARSLQVIRAVERNDLSVRVPITSGDEIGRVQIAFNHMLDQLNVSLAAIERQNRELAILNGLSEAIALGQSRQDVLDRALREVGALIGADLGTVYLLDDSRQFIHLAALLGAFPEEMRPSVSRRPVAESPMRRVLESGNGILVQDVRGSPEYAPDMARMVAAAGYRAWIGAPLKTETGVLGVINLVRRQDPPFTSSDLSTLEAVAKVLGVGLANANLLAELRKKDEELHRAFALAVQYQEEERRRLSRELHDEIGQALTSILIRLKALQQESVSQEFVDRLDGLRYLTSQAIEDLRRLAMDLRPAALDNLGILPALRGYVQQAAEQSGRIIHFLAPARMRRLPGEIELVLYRVAQECVNNAIRHSQAERIEVVLEVMPRAVWLSVNDNGRGFDPAQTSGGLGLIGVRERVELLKGTYCLQTGPGEGTRVWVEIPLPGEESPHAA